MIAPRSPRAEGPSPYWSSERSCSGLTGGNKAPPWVRGQHHPQGPRGARGCPVSLEKRQPCGRFTRASRQLQTAQVGTFLGATAVFKSGI